MGWWPRSSVVRFAALVVAFVVSACAGQPAGDTLLPKADAPKTSVRRAMRGRALCRAPKYDRPNRDVFVRCFPGAKARADHTMAVVAYADAGRMQSLEWMEGYVRHHDAGERYRELVARRTEQLGAPTDDARRYFRQPPSPRATWAAWLVPERRSLIAVVLHPQGTRGPTVVESVAVVPDSRTTW